MNTLFFAVMVNVYLTKCAFDSGSSEVKWIVTQYERLVHVSFLFN